MSLPMCAELPLMMLFSMLCTDDNGNVVDIRVDVDQPIAATIVPPSHTNRDIDTDTYTETSIETKLFGGSISNHETEDSPLGRLGDDLANVMKDDNDNDNDDDNNNHQPLGKLGEKLGNIMK